jgi:8-oxo-dGTP diphosphatase
VSDGAPVVAVGGVAVADGSLLLVRRGSPPQQGRWSIPGGRVEEGETLAEAVERELEEETGIAARCGPLLGIAERLGAGYHFVILDFVVHTEAPASLPRAGGDADEAAWVPLALVPELDLVDGVEEFLRSHGVLA